MSKEKIWMKISALVMAALMISLPACVSSEVKLGSAPARMIGQKLESTVQIPSTPVAQITKKPTVADPQAKIKVEAEMVQRETIIQRYERMEKVRQTTSGDGLMVVGGISMGVGFFSWMINYLKATDTTSASGATLTDAEIKENEDTYGPKASQGATIILLGLIPLIAGASMDRQEVETVKPIAGSGYDSTTYKENPLGRKVTVNNHPIITSVGTNQKQETYRTSTNNEGEATIRIDNYLTEYLGNGANPLPESVNINIQPQGGTSASLYYNITEAISIMSSGKVDWTKGAEGLTPFPEAKLEFGGKAKASETVIFKINVSNKKGKGDCFQLQAVIKSNGEPFFDNQRIFIGRLIAGEDITIERAYQIPKLWRGRDIPLTITFEELHKNIPEFINATLTIEGLPRPNLVKSSQIIDGGTEKSVGNGDGIIQRGEAVDIEVTVNNIGEGPATNVNAELDFAGPPIDGINIVNKRISLGDLKPNESKKDYFTVVFKRATQVAEVKFNLKISETGLLEESQYVENLKIGAPSELKPTAINPKTAYVTGNQIMVRAGASADSAPRFNLNKGSALQVVGYIGDYYKVDMGKNIYGWVAKNDFSFDAPKDLPTTTAMTTPTEIKVIQQIPPLIALASPSELIMQTTEDSIRVSGTIVDDRSVEKVDILINNNLFKSLNTRGIAVIERPNAESKKDYRFGETVTLKPGLNEIKIVAYDDEGLSKTQLVKVTKVEEKGEVYVLVVGITKYEDKTITQLPYAEVDAQSIYDFYAKSPKSIAKTENVSLVLGKNATAKGIRSAISALAKKAKESDTVIFYYAGHGDTGKHPNKGTEYYMIPQDAAKDDLFGSAIELSDLQRLWGAVISKRKVFIADSCNSGGFTELRGEGDTGFEQGLGEGTVVMTAASRKEKALEVPELKHGLFTYYFLKGIEGEADVAKDGKVSINEMKKYVEENVRNKARELGGVQTPVTKIETTGEIYLTK